MLLTHSVFTLAHNEIAISLERLGCLNPNVHAPLATSHDNEKATVSNAIELAILCCFVMLWCVDIANVSRPNEIRQTILDCAGDHNERLEKRLLFLYG